MLSKLSEKCKKCLHADNCDEKRMEVCAVIDGVKEIEIKPNILAPLTMQLTAPTLRDTSIETQRKEEIEKQITNEIYKELYKHTNCSFQKI